MPSEIERKFLVTNDDWRALVDRSSRYRQGYLNSAEKCSIRVRVDGERGYLNIKSATLSIERTEYEYPIPLDDAQDMLDRFCLGALVEKTRYFVPHAKHLWEVDVFEGDNAGLVVAEVELDAIDEVIDLPAWVGEDVSHDARYYNVYLAKHPFKDW